MPSEQASALRTRVRLAVLVSIAVYGIVRIRNPEYWDPLNDLNLAVHEAGHLVVSPFGETLGILGGEDSIHDWRYLLINWDLLPRDTVIARGVHFFGVVAFLSSLLGGALWLRYSARAQE